MYVARVLSFAVSPRHVFKLLDSVFNFADRVGFQVELHALYIYGF